MTVKVQYEDQSQSLEYSEVDNTYIKGCLFCVQIGDKVYKHPISRIWRITESYGKHQ